MLFISDGKMQFDRLADRLRHAEAVTPVLMSDAISILCPRLPLLNRGNATSEITQLMKSGAWLDTGLSLVELELPGWGLRRLVYDGGEWHCSLSSQTNLPVELDDTVDASHTVAALAILLALSEAKRNLMQAATTTVPTVRLTPMTPTAVCCDNFG